MEQLIGIHCYICYVANYENARIGRIQKGSGKEKFQYCPNADDLFHHMHVIHGHSGGIKIDPLLQDIVKNSVHVERVPLSRCSSLCLQSIIHSGLTAGKRYKRRKTNTILHSRGSHDQLAIRKYQDVSKPRKVQYKNEVESLPGCSSSD